jgi:diacylglycerol O-acyltransferase / wax synthase
MAEDHNDELGPTDVLLHRGEANPRFRSGLIGVEILDTTPNWDRYLNRFDDASRRVARLRQKVVMPTFPTTAPRWVIDPDFDLTFHVRGCAFPNPERCGMFSTWQR